MDRHLLLTMGGDARGAWNLAFVSSFFRDKSALQLTLFYVVAEAYCDKPGGCTLSDEQLAQARKVLDEARKVAVSGGFDPARVEVKAVPRQFGVLRDIIAEGHKGLYDAVVTGRRYHNWLERAYASGVSDGLMAEDVAFPLWVCHKPDPALANVLLCVDGSCENLRMADHIGFMLGGLEEHDITLFHCRQKGLDAEAVLDHAHDALTTNGVAESRITRRVVDAPDRADAILQEAREGGYAVVALGRRQSLPDSMLRRMFGGTVTERLHRNVDRFSLWVST